MQSQPATTLPDIQSTKDHRNVAINKVGVKAVRYPITLRTPGNGSGTGTQSTVATINMYVALPPRSKGLTCPDLSRSSMSTTNPFHRIR